MEYNLSGTQSSVCSSKMDLGEAVFGWVFGRCIGRYANG